jgi:uncharacterized protein involved in exopolysaccharide biosynthesis
MSAPVEIKAVLRSQRLFERLLALYPKAHRAQYGPAMSQLFRDQCRDAWRARRTWGLVSLWLHVLPDLVETSLLEHLSTLKGRKSMLEKIAEITNTGTAPLKAFFTVFAVVFLLVFGTTALVTFLLPETYAGAVRVKVERNPIASQGQDGPATAAGVHDPYFIQTEFEILQSEAILGRVIEALNLNARWGERHAGNGVALKTPETLALLKGRLELRPVRNTSLIEIRVYGEDPNETAAIANAIAETYQNHRAEKGQQLALSAFKSLEARFDEQEEKVRHAQQEVGRLRKELGISELDAGGDSPSPTLEAETVRQLQGQLIASQTALAREQLQLKELEKLTPDQRRDALQTVLGSDNELSSLLVENNLAQQRLLALRNDYSLDHPVYHNAATLSEHAAKRVNQRMEGIMTGLRTRVSAMQAAAENLEGKLEQARLADIEKAERSRPYFDAKQKLDELMRFRAVLNLKLTSERLEAELPKAATVEIIDRASPSRQSIRPNKPRNLFLGAIAGLVLGTLIGVAVAGGSFWIRRKAPSHAAAV